MKEVVKTLCSKTSYSYSWKKNGTYGYKSADQLLKDAAEDPRQERIPFHSSASGTAASGNKFVTFPDVVEEVDDYNSDLIAGTIDYNTYKESIEELNKDLEKQNSIYKVNTIRKDQVGDLLHILPAQLVVYAKTGDEVDHVYNDWGWGDYS